MSALRGWATAEPRHPVRTAGPQRQALERRQREQGIVGGILGIEGAHALDGKLENLDALFVVQLPRNLNLDAVSAATRSLVGRHDFSAFALAGGGHGQPFRKILSAIWVVEGDQLELRIVGDGFLRGMVRSLVGTLLEIGEGRRPESDMERLLTGLPRSEAGRTAAAQGLSLERVYYGPEWRPLGRYVA